MRREWEEEAKEEVGEAGRGDGCGKRKCEGDGESEGRGVVLGPEGVGEGGYILRELREDVEVVKTVDGGGDEGGDGRYIEPPALAVVLVGVAGWDDIEIAPSLPLSKDLNLEAPFPVLATVLPPRCSSAPPLIDTSRSLSHLSLTGASSSSCSFIRSSSFEVKPLRLLMPELNKLE